MTSLAAFDRFCRELPGSNFIVQWGDCHVHKVGPKLVAFSMEGGYVFKATPMGFALLTEQRLAQRAPYLRRGYWLYTEKGALKQAEFFAYLQESYRLAVAALTRVQRRELGLD